MHSDNRKLPKSSQKKTAVISRLFFSSPGDELASYRIGWKLPSSMDESCSYDGKTSTRNLNGDPFHSDLYLSFNPYINLSFISFWSFLFVVYPIPSCPGINWPRDINFQYAFPRSVWLSNWLLSMSNRLICLRRFSSKMGLAFHYWGGVEEGSIE